MPIYIDKEKQKRRIKIIRNVIIALIIFVWLILPPHNKFIQIAMIWDSIKYFSHNISNTNAYPEYMYNRNKAVYYAKMGIKYKKESLRAMNKSIALASKNDSIKNLDSLYSDSAILKLYFGDQREAFEDYKRISNLNYNDYLPAAMLYKDHKKFRVSVKYCTHLVKVNTAAYIGYACLADVYKAYGKPKVALRIYALAMDRTKSGLPYIDRARLRSEMGDRQGADEDIKMAKERLGDIDMAYSLTDAAVNPKKIDLEVISPF